MNKEILEEKLKEDKLRKSIEPIKITKYALDKSNYIAKRINELANEYLEIGLLLLDDPKKQEKEGVVVRDVYIMHDQQVTDIHFHMTGAGEITSLRDIYNNLKKKPVGLGHSHIGGVFFSPEDKGSLKDILRDGIYNEINIEDFGEIRYSLSMVFNANNSPPHIGISYPSAEDRSAINVNNFRLIEYLGHNVIKTEQELSDGEKKILDQQILEKVKIGTKEGYMFLKDKFPQKYEGIKKVAVGYPEVKRKLPPIGDLMNEIRAYQEKKDIIGMTKQLEVLRREFDIYKSNYIYTAEDLKDLNQKIGTLQQQSQTYKSAHPYTIDQFNQLEQKISVLSKELETAKSQLSGERQCYASDLKEKESLFDKKLEERTEQYEEEIKKLRGTIEQVKTETKTNYEKEIEELKQKIKIYEKKELEKEVFIPAANYSSGINQLIAKYRSEVTKESELAAITAQILSGRYEKDGKRVWSWSERLSALREIYKSDTSFIYEQDKAEIINTLGINKYLNKKHSSLRKSLDEIITSKVVEKESLYSKLENLTEERDSLKLELEKKDGEMSKYTKEREALEDKLKTSEKEKEELRTELSKAKDSIADYEQKIKKYEESKERPKDISAVREEIKESPWYAEKDRLVNLINGHRQETEELKQPKKGFFNKIKSYFTKDKLKQSYKILNYVPVVGALMKKDKAVDKVISSLEDKIKDNKIDGKELYESMYSSGVSNIATERAIKKKLKEKNIGVEGNIESKYKVESKFVNFLNKYLLLGKIGRGLEIYKGRNAWETFKLNTKIGGEVSAMVQATAISTFGVSLYHALSSSSNALDDALKDKYQTSKYLGWAGGILGLSGAINSGSVTAAARSANNLVSQINNSKLSKHWSKHKDKVAHLTQLAAQGFMLGASASVAYDELSKILQHEPVPPPPPPPPPPPIFTEEQLQALKQSGWVDSNNDGIFEYKLSDLNKGDGISQILVKSDKSIGNDPILTAKESGLLAHKVATTSGSEVDNIGNGTFKDLRDPSKYVIHVGDTLYADENVVKSFF